MHRFGNWLLGYKTPILRTIYWTAYNLLSRYVRNHNGIELPLTAKLGRRLFIGHQHGIVLHPKVVVGDNCLIRHGVTLGDAKAQGDNPVPFPS